MIWRTTVALGGALDERAAAERALADTAVSLRAADAQKDAFLATLSHELRNPLAPIQFALHMLEERGPVAERAKQMIRRQVSHLVRLVDDLLDLTRITHNKLRLHLSAVDVRQALRDAADAVDHDVKKADQQLTVAPLEEPLWVRADPDRLVQMLVNLLTNAVRYSSAGGQIMVAAEADGADVVFSVRDEGAGLAAADLERVFDMFVQVGEALHGGLGVGLALVKGLAALHGGSVEARSAGLGQGSEFRVRLPRVAAAVEPLAAEARATVPAHPRSILIVDDNLDAADGLAHLLSLRGHAVAVAYNGSGALEIAQVQRPDVGLLDVGLPDVDGLTLATRLRSDPRTAGMLLVAITGWGQEEDRQRALAAGFDAHVTKPADLSALLAIIDTHAKTLNDSAGTSAQDSA